MCATTSDSADLLRLMERYNLALVPIRVYEERELEREPAPDRLVRTLWAVTSPEAKRCYLVGDGRCTGWLEDCWRREELFESPEEAIRHSVAVLEEIAADAAGPSRIASAG